MKKFIHKIILLILVVSCVYSFVISCHGGHEDISGTIIAKSDEINSRYKSRRIYTEYIFAIHPDDNRLNDFDIQVPLYNYVKFNVGDKVTFRDENIRKYLKDPKWYEKDDNLAMVSMILFISIMVYFLFIIGTFNKETWNEW